MEPHNSTKIRVHLSIIYIIQYFIAIIKVKIISSLGKKPFMNLQQIISQKLSQAHNILQMY